MTALIAYPEAQGRLADLERIERDAWLDAYVVAERVAGQALQASHGGRAGAALTAMRAIDVGLFNRAQGAGCDGPFSDDDAAAAADWLKRHAAPNWRFQLAPPSLPADFDARALRLGLERKGRGPAKLHRGAAPLEAAPEAALPVEPVTADMADACADLAMEVWGLPPAFKPWMAAMVVQADWRAYAVVEDGAPVGFGLAFMRNGWAWMGWDSVRREARGRGAHTALIRRRIADGLARGAEHFVAEAAAPSDDDAASVSYRNYVRAGFAPAYIRTAYGPA